MSPTTAYRHQVQKGMWREFSEQVKFRTTIVFTMHDHPQLSVFAHFKNIYVG